VREVNWFVVFSCQSDEEYTGEKEFHTRGKGKGLMSMTALLELVRLRIILAILTCLIQERPKRIQLFAVVTVMAFAEFSSTWE